MSVAEASAGQLLRVAGAFVLNLAAAAFGRESLSLPSGEHSPRNFIHWN